MTECDQKNQRLIEENQGLVFHLASRVCQSLPVQKDFDDLVGYGMVGLAEAAKSYSPSRGVKFSTFAFLRIRGAIYDGISESSWMSRAEYRNQLNRRLAAEEARQTGEPGEADADGAGWKGSESQVVELTPEHAAELAEPEPESMPDRVAGSETAQQLCLAVEDLPRREKMLITMVYFNGDSLQAAADKIGVSKSWASRLHARVLQKLGRALNSKFRAK